MLLLCIKKCPVDVRRFLASRIVTCGGGANICGTFLYLICVNHQAKSYTLCISGRLQSGLADRIVADAVQLTDSMSLFPEHAALAPLAGDLRNVSLYFKPSDMSWVGGSMFAADKVAMLAPFSFKINDAVFYLYRH